MSSSDLSKALLMQHYLKDLTIMFSGMAFLAAGASHPHCLAFPPQSNVAFINSKNCSGFAVFLLLCALNNFTIKLCCI
jgi:hypothetical protein